MKNPLILYSTNSTLAYRINNKFYGNKHYVYVTDSLGSTEIESSFEANPPSSRPLHRYNRLKSEVQNPDQGEHYYIDENKAGIKRGADAKLRDGIITQKECDVIYAICETISLNEFLPVIYEMPYDLVSHMLEDVPVSKKANPFSVEWIIKALPGELFVIVRY